MEITAALAADLALLTQALDEPSADIAATLRQLGSDARVALRSYLGLTVTMGDPGRERRFTTMEELAAPIKVRASLMMSLVADATGPRIGVILYAASPGAFVDLAADLSWLTGLELHQFALDQHLSPAGTDPGGIAQATSLINQAIGVLIGRGRTPAQASGELDALADEAGITRDDAARSVLRGVKRSD
ncbi:MAG TPA: hypothetical protein VE442_26775 [Jatrophihabitans sp.]|nr:hypothetical protein [Jatrophihabitans sp.]